MLSAWMLLMLNSLFITLRLSGGGGSFPRPLKAEEERLCLERFHNGDMEARNKLIEHNLRLVAHIMKKYYSKRQIAPCFAVPALRQAILESALRY
jgi:RNA polymerase sporulation-specific sigma factor